ncbi:hypothetical protein [Methylotenera sp.]|uniref:hypothetical protein n=1 Tax=Methylotenera sp. TaxID=2051956 RepID=UPI0027352ED0|nr:hypothetical protein [Methylotenera sp.]MDP3210612.1 hypothetical protein [Methylotenera sp.]
MGTSVYTSLLIKDFKRKAGNIKALRKDLRDLARVVMDMEKEQAALLTVIQSREPDFLPSSVKPISTAPKVLGLPWNRLSSLVQEAIKNSENQGMLKREITNYVIINGPVSAENRRAFTIINRCVLDCLRRLRKKGILSSTCFDRNEAGQLWTFASTK